MSVSSVPLNSTFADLNNTTTLMTSMTMDMFDTPRDSNTPGVPAGEKLQDCLIQRYELEDTVCSIDWSGSEAWVFAGVSYNGTFFLNLVPSKEKYKILL